MKSEIEFVLEDDYETRSVKELVEEFYRHSIYKQCELKKKFKRRKIAIPPIKIVLNPPGWGRSESSKSDDIYIAIYYRGYLIRIEHGSDLYGPHPFKLFFQVRTGYRVWLGTHKHSFMFYDLDAVNLHLNKTIRGKQFYCSPKSALEVIEIRRNASELKL